MGITDYYDIPYPELTDEPDGAAQMKAIADRIEVILKNGYTIPSGNLTVGDPAVALQKAFTSATKSGADAYDLSLLIHSAGYGIIILKKNAAEINRFIIGIDGSIQAHSGGVQRPFPYATWAGRGNVTVSAAVNGSAAFTLPVGRFTATPGVNGFCANATVVGVNNYFAYLLAPADNASVSVGVRHADNTVASTAVGVMVTVTQMTPTSGPG